MVRETSRRQSGFTMLETAVVVLVTGTVVAFAAPKISNAMREYRLNIGMRQMADLVQRVKTQAVSDNRKASLVIDTANKKMGLTTYDVNGNVVRTDYVPLPQGITFTAPAGLTAPVTGAPTSNAVSFAAKQGSTTVFQQDFNSRGFPVVAPGAVNAVYLSNGNTFRAVTVNCIGGARKWVWTVVHDSNGQWSDTQ